MEGITFKEAPPRGVLIAAVAFPHQSDNHLWLVMTRDGDEYIRWTHNTRDGGYHHGHYYGPDRRKAYLDFAERLTKLTAVAHYA